MRLFVTVGAVLAVVAMVETYTGVEEVEVMGNPILEEVEVPGATAMPADQVDQAL
jgi:hypothetical protein